ncbi:MAG: hypothetical protein ACK5WR_15380 [Planctomycetaceae bacterium]
MQRRLVTWLVAILLIAHGLLGCCWHHRHVHAGPESVTPPQNTAPLVVAATTPAAGPACCHHRHQRHAAEPVVRESPACSTAPANPAEPAPDAPCTEDDCVFVASSRGTVSGDQPDSAIPHPCGFEGIPGWRSLPQLAVPGGWIGHLRSGPAAAGDLRAHRVRTGVWLI